MSEAATTRREDRKGRISGEEKAEEQPLTPGTPPGETEAQIQVEGNHTRNGGKQRSKNKSKEGAHREKKSAG